MIYLPIIGAVLEAAGQIFEKKILKNKFMNFKNYTVFEFFSIIIMGLPFIYFFYSIKAEAFSLWNLGIFGAVILIAVFANILTFYSLKRENITVMEPIWLMQPLFTILLAFLIYPNEREWMIIGLALIASVTLVLAHIKKHHLVFDKYILAALLGSFLFAVELVLSKSILDYYSPFMFYYIRCTFIFLISLAIFRPSFKPVFNKKALWMFICLGIVWIFYRTIMYYGYDTLGIVFTTMMFILSPVFLLLFARVFLKEKISLRQIISTLIIIGCVILAVFLNWN
jgi:drug/metabolite transporter (DMT)-like permease